MPNFTAPQSYLYLDNYPELKEFVFNNLIPEENVIINNLENILPDKLCR